MTPSSNMDGLADRFAPHIEMLREFLSSRDMPFGAPRDLYLLVERLSVPSAFDKDMASMLRTIMFREGMGITRVELLELVTIAAGGAQVEQAAQEIHEPVGKLLAFIHEVLRSMHRPAGDAFPETGAAPVPVPAPAQKAVPSNLPNATPEQTSFTAASANAASANAASLNAAPTSAAPPGSSPESLPRASSSFRPNPFRPVTSVAASAPPVPSPANRPIPAAPRAAQIARSPGFPPIAAQPAAHTAVETASQAATGAPDPSWEQRLRSALDLSPQGLRIFGSSAFALCVLALAFAWNLHRRTAAPTAAVPHVQARPAVVMPPPVISPTPAPSGDAGAELSAGPPSAELAASPASEKNADSASTGSRAADASQAFNASRAADISRASSASRAFNASRAFSRTPPRATAGRPVFPAAGYRSPTQTGPPLSSSQQAGSALAGSTSPPSNPGSGRLAYQPSPSTDYSQGAAPGFERSAPPERTIPIASTKSRPEPSVASRASRLQGVASVSSGVMTSHLLSAPPPAYPTMARVTHVEGEVILQAVIARDGTVSTTHALRGHHLLRGAAEHAVRRWRYRPYLIEGHPTEVATIVTVDFQLHR